MVIKGLINCPLAWIAKCHALMEKVPSSGFDLDTLNFFLLKMELYAVEVISYKFVPSSLLCVWLCNYYCNQGIEHLCLSPKLLSTP